MPKTTLRDPIVLDDAHRRASGLSALTWRDFAPDHAAKIANTAALRSTPLPSIEEFAAEDAEWRARLDEIATAATLPVVHDLGSVPDPATWAAANAANTVLAESRRVYCAWLRRTAAEALEADRPAILDALQPVLDELVAEVAEFAEVLEETGSALRIENVADRATRTRLRDAVDLGEQVSEVVRLVRLSSEAKDRRAIGGVLFHGYKKSRTTEPAEDVAEALDEATEWAWAKALARAARRGPLTLRAPADALAAAEADRAAEDEAREALAARRRRS